jgi:hypothetical protein
MTEGYTYRDHIRDADRHVSGARLCDDPEEVRQELQAARASITRALILLPKVKDEDDAA